MKVAICLPGNNFSGNFLGSLIDLTSYLMREGIEFSVVRVEGANIYNIRNICARYAVKKSGFNPDFLLWIDSDTVFKAKDFKTLLDLNIDIASGYCRTLSKAFNFGMKGETYVSAMEIPSDKPFEVDFVGFGFVLIKASVFEKVEEPWFDMNFDGNEFIGEDVSFCQKARDKNLKIIVHPDIRVGHEKKLVI